MPITRTNWIDDDGTGTVGTVVNNAAKTEIYNQIDATAAFCADPNIFTNKNTFNVSQTDFIDTGGAANARVWNLWTTGGFLYWRALNDALTAQVAAPLRLDRLGNAFVEQDLYEKSRPTPIGHWIDIPFSAANFFSNTGSWTVSTVYVQAYALIGKTILYAVHTNGIIAGSPTTLSVYLPSGFVSARHTLGHSIYTTASNGVGLAAVVPGGQRVDLTLLPTGAAWVNGNTFIGFTMTISLQ